MQYHNIDDLPKGVRDNLPEHAQHIWKAAFNNAYTEYADPSKRHGDESQVEVAAKVAWAAVEHEYHKDASGNWVENASD